MTIKVMTWVWEHSRSRNGARLVLLAIADAASDDGTNAWPSVATIAKKANLSDRAVQAALKELVVLGELKVKMNAGRNGTNRYSVIMSTPEESAPPKNLHPEESAGAETGADEDDKPQDPPKNLHPEESAPPKNATQTPEESAPKPNTNKNKKKTSSSSSSTAAKTPPPEHPRFAEFWAVYPLKVGKAKGREAFTNAIDVLGADPETLITSAARYGRHLARTKTERQWKCHPASWLNGERWEDDLDDGPPAADQPPLLPDWCGKCDQPTRTTEDHDGRWGPCPTCHPDAERTNP